MHYIHTFFLLFDYSLLHIKFPLILVDLYRGVYVNYVIIIISSHAFLLVYHLAIIWHKIEYCSNTKNTF